VASFDPAFGEQLRVGAVHDGPAHPELGGQCPAGRQPLAPCEAAFGPCGAELGGDLCGQRDGAVSGVRRAYPEAKRARLTAVKDA
jgi:hypothetical protein